MKQVILLLICVLTIFSSCKKDELQIAIIGQWTWTLETRGNPIYNTTPQNTGINEVFTFNPNGVYNVSQNNVTVNEGTYKLTTATSTRGSQVSSVLFSNQRVKDSVYYYLIINNDSLIFNYDFIGTVGSISRHYIKK